MESMPGAWTAGVRTRPKAVRVIRERERLDKWQSVSSWMRIGAPYRCHSFVCGHTLSCDGEKVLPLLRWNVGFFGHGLLSFLPCRSHRVWECDSPWILGDVLTAGWRAIVLPLCLQFTFFSLPSSLLYRGRILFHPTFRVAPRLTSSLFLNVLAPDGPLTWNINRRRGTRRALGKREFLRSNEIDPTMFARESVYFIHTYDSPSPPLTHSTFQRSFLPRESTFLNAA